MLYVILNPKWVKNPAHILFDLKKQLSFTLYFQGVRK